MRVILIWFCLVTSAVAQDYNFSNSWQFLGPFMTNQIHQQISQLLELVQSNLFESIKKIQQFLLAGSISGGLFFSEDGGENWMNSGSDAWDYSGCGWADFYPENEKIWFAFSNHADNNGKPGKAGVWGGIMRSMNSGTTWERVASGGSLFNNEDVAIYGFSFLPDKPEVLFVLSDAGLFYTENCLSESVVWKKVSELLME
jgi:hypothetical protein